ncbi:hypothetical protein NDI43_09285 [Microcoleus vaginatus GB2-A3]|uniref:hypothetical protein n=1 Tax=Microcoleus vaginatus TaxID=119532 RepID=UPI0032A2E351
MLITANCSISSRKNLRSAIAPVQRSHSPYNNKDRNPQVRSQYRIDGRSPTGNFEVLGIEYCDRQLTIDCAEKTMN